MKMAILKNIFNQDSCWLSELIPVEANKVNVKIKIPQNLEYTLHHTEKNKTYQTFYAHINNILKGSENNANIGSGTESFPDGWIYLEVLETPAEFINILKPVDGHILFFLQSKRRSNDPCYNEDHINTELKKTKLLKKYENARLLMFTFDGHPSYDRRIENPIVHIVDRTNKEQFYSHCLAFVKTMKLLNY